MSVNKSLTMTQVYNIKILNQLLMLIGLIICVSVLSAQRTLTVDDVVKLTIQHNYSVQLAEQNIKLSENNASKDNFGYKPTVNAILDPNATIGGSTQQFNNGSEATTGTALSLAVGAGVNANYLLFDESRSIKLDQMKERLNLSNVQLRQAIENSLSLIHI